MGMFDTMTNLESGFARFSMGLACFSEVRKRVRRVTKGYRSCYTHRRTWADRFKGIPSHESYVTQFEENGSNFFQYGADVFNEVFNVLLGSGKATCSAEQYQEIHELVYSGESGSPFNFTNKDLSSMCKVMQEAGWFEAFGVSMEDVDFDDLFDMPSYDIKDNLEADLDLESIFESIRPQQTNPFHPMYKVSH